MSPEHMPFNLDPRWFAPLLLTLFAVAWLGAGWLVSRAGGWASLAARFPADGVVEGERFRFASGAFGRKALPTRYNGVLYVTVNRRGLGLSLWFPFRFGSSPMFIPWSAFESATERRRMFSPTVEFTVRDHWARVWLRGEAAMRAKAAFDSKERQS